MIDGDSATCLTIDSPISDEMEVVVTVQTNHLCLQNNRIKIQVMKKGKRKIPTPDLSIFDSILMMLS